MSRFGRIFSFVNRRSLILVGSGGTGLALGAYYSSYRREWRRQTERESLLASARASSVPAALCDAGTPSEQAVEEEKKEEKKKKKPTIVVVGSGWAAYSFLREVDTDLFNVVVLALDRQFLLTPLLSQVATGQVQPASASTELPLLLGEQAEAMRFVKGRALDVDFEQRTVLFRDLSTKKRKRLAYDQLVLAIGAENNRFGLSEQIAKTPNVYPLRSLRDANEIRTAVVRAFESARQPGLSDEKRQNMLKFAVVGGGPVSIDFAVALRRYVSQLAAVHDFGSGSLPSLEPTVTLIDVGDYNANAYDVKIAEQARSRASFTEEQYRVAKVTAVKRGALELRRERQGPAEEQQADEAESRHLQQEFGVCIWATARGPSPLTKRLQERLDAGSVQNNRHALVTDDHLRIRGAPRDTAFALGDCATISQDRLVDSIVALFHQLDVNHDESLSPEEFHALVKNYQAEFPQLSEWEWRTDQLFEEADVNKDGSLSTEEFRQLLMRVDQDVTRLPSTAQVALQQGKYLGRLLSNNTLFLSTRRGQQDIQEGLYASDESGNLPFRYKHWGGFEYVGYDNTITERGTRAVSIIDGFGARWLWSSVLVSWATPARLLIRSALDKVSTLLFGPDLTNN